MFTKKQVGAIIALLAAVLASFGIYVNQSVQDAATEAVCIGVDCVDSHATGTVE